MITIGIDIRVLGSKMKSGIEEYTENLLSNIFSIDPKIKFKLFYSSFKNDLPKYDWLQLPNVEIRSFRLPNRLLSGSLSILGRPRIDHLLGGVDVFFSPHLLFAPLSVKCKRAVTFHDLSYLSSPEFFSFKKKMWHKFMMPEWQANFADKIITVSESTKKDISNHYDIDPNKIQVIYSGVSPAMSAIDETDLKDFRSKNGLPEKFILFLGKLEPRKNVVGLVRAFNILKASAKFGDVHLVIAGSRGWLYEDIFKEIERSAHKDQIKYIGHLKDEERPFYYNLASVFVYPSFFEGFGLPPLEAMACGIPVVTSNNSSLPEVVGDAALLVNPFSTLEISRAIGSILEDNSLRQNLAKKGLRRSTLFSWPKVAEKTLDLLVRL